MIKKQLLILLILMSSLAGYSQTITPQYRAVSGGLLSYFYSGKSPAGYDTLWNAQTIRGYVNNGSNPFTIALKHYADSLHALQGNLTGNNTWTGPNTFTGGLSTTTNFIVTNANGHNNNNTGDKIIFDNGSFNVGVRAGGGGDIIGDPILFRNYSLVELLHLETGNIFMPYLSVTNAPVNGTDVVRRQDVLPGGSLNNSYSKSQIDSIPATNALVFYVAKKYTGSGAAVITGIVGKSAITSSNASYMKQLTAAKAGDITKPFPDYWAARNVADSLRNAGVTGNFTIKSLGGNTYIVGSDNSSLNGDTLYNKNGHMVADVGFSSSNGATVSSLLQKGLVYELGYDNIYNVAATYNVAIGYQMDNTDQSFSSNLFDVNYRGYYGAKENFTATPFLIDNANAAVRIKLGYARFSQGTAVIGNNFSLLDIEVQNQESSLTQAYFMASTRNGSDTSVTRSSIRIHNLKFKKNLFRTDTVQSHISRFYNLGNSNSVRKKDWNLHVDNAEFLSSDYAGSLFYMNTVSGYEYRNVNLNYTIDLLNHTYTPFYLGSSDPSEYGLISQGGQIGSADSCVHNRFVFNFPNAVIQGRLGRSGNNWSTNSGTKDNYITVNGNISRQKSASIYPGVWGFTRISARPAGEDINYTFTGNIINDDGIAFGPFYTALGGQFLNKYNIRANVTNTTSSAVVDFGSTGVGNSVAFSYASLNNSTSSGVTTGLIGNATGNYNIPGSTNVVLTGAISTGALNYEASTGLQTKLPVGTANQHLMGGTIPTYVTPTVAFSTTGNANGGSYSGDALTLAAATATQPGLVSQNTQTMGAGKKTFPDNIVVGKLGVASRMEIIRPSDGGNTGYIGYHDAATNGAFDIANNSSAGTINFYVNNVNRASFSTTGLFKVRNLLPSLPIFTASDTTFTNSGTVPVGNGGTGQTTYTNGQILIGNTTGNTLTKSTLTAGNNISITNGAGTITIATASQYLRLTGSGTGAATTISIAHGLSGVSSTSNVFVTPKNAASSGIQYITTDATNVNIVYSVAPASGTNNLSYDILIKP